MPTLTPQQRHPLDVRAVSVALGAGAGCGKTTVLTERFVAALAGTAGGRGRIPLDRMVALTFTDKAAGELRSRVRAACRARLDGGEDDAHWRGVLRGLEAAPIGTFHTFCGEVVRRYAVRAGVDPGFAILDEAGAGGLREAAVDACLRSALMGRDPDLRALAVTFGLDGARAILVALMADRSAGDLDAWGALEPEALVARWVAAFDAKARPALIARFLRGARPCLDLIRSRREGFPAKMADTLAAIEEAVLGVESEPDLAAALRAIREHAKMPPGLRADKWPDPALNPTCKEVFEGFRKAIDAIVKGLDHDDASTTESAAMGLRLARVGASAWRRLEGIKRSRGALDFNDLLLKARDLLRDDSGPARAELSARFDLILVDEFQDTDPVQDEIVRLIAGEGLADGRLFLVGDFKQSIYGFRGARPALFSRYRDEFPAEGRLPLTENFRSRPAILDFVNALFAEAFEDEYEPLTPGQADPLPDGLPAVVFAWPEVGEEADGRDVDALRRDEADRLARLIRSWIDEGRPVFDKAARAVRPIRAGDVAILFKSNDAFRHYERALPDVGLDYHVTGGSAYHAQQEVLDLTNLLAAIDDPHDSLALAGALRGPAFALSDEALYWLASVRPGDLNAGLAHCDPETLPGLSARDRRLALRAAELLARWRGLKDREPVATLVARVLDESGLEAALLGEFLGDRKVANARKLVRVARKADAEGGSLAGFVDRLRADSRKPPREEQAGTTGDLASAVRLLTVHKAKGLEFPAVIVPDLDREAKGPHEFFALDPDLGPLLEVGVESDEGDEGQAAAGGSLGRLVRREVRRADDEAEALRVFYVAATRARDLLVLSTSGDPSSPPKSPALTLLQARFDLDAGIARGPLPDGRPGPEVEVLRGTPRLARGASRPARRSPPLLAIASLIESLPEPEPEATSPAPPPAIRPAFVDVDPATALGPDSPAGRLDRLARAILLDPRSTRRDALEAVAADHARWGSPAVPPRLVAEAVERLRGRVEGPLGRALATAAEVRRDIPWTVAWPAGPDGPTVVAGRLDLAYRDAAGTWTLLQVADDRTDPAAERLRLLLSAHLAPRLGLGPIARAWHLTHGPDGGLAGEDRFDATAVDAALAALLSVPGHVG